jgi:hypothetical protein
MIFAFDLGWKNAMRTSWSPLGRRRVAVEDLAGAVQQVRVHAAAGEEPVPGDAIAPRNGHGAAALARRARRDADGIAEEQLAADFGGELRGLAEGVDAHGHAPAGRAVGPGDLLDDPQRGEDVGAQAALGDRQRHLEEAGVRQLQHEVGGQLTAGLDLGRSHADARRERTGDLEGTVHRPRRAGRHRLDGP